MKYIISIILVNLIASVDNLQSEQNLVTQDFSISHYFKARKKICDAFSGIMSGIDQYYIQKNEKKLLDILNQIHCNYAQRRKVKVIFCNTLPETAVLTIQNYLSHSSLKSVCLENMQQIAKYLYKINQSKIYDYRLRKILAIVHALKINDISFYCDPFKMFRNVCSIIGYKYFFVPLEHRVEHYITNCIMPLVKGDDLSVDIKLNICFNTLSIVNSVLLFSMNDEDVDFLINDENADMNFELLLAKFAILPSKLQESVRFIAAILKKEKFDKMLKIELMNQISCIGEILDHI